MNILGLYKYNFAWTSLSDAGFPGCPTHLEVPAMFLFFLIYLLIDKQLHIYKKYNLKLIYEETYSPLNILLTTKSRWTGKLIDNTI